MLQRLAAEVAGPEQLERDAGEQRRGHRERAEQARERVGAAGEGEGNGRKPAARRDCESETASEKCANSHGTSDSSSTSTEPPSTKRAPSAARGATTASGTDEQRRDGDGAAAAEHATASSR